MELVVTAICVFALIGGIFYLDYIVEKAKKDMEDFEE